MLIPPDIKKKVLRRMKYTSDQQGIMNRYLAEGHNWEDHLFRTRTFIRECLEKSGARTVAVLGSGWLLDLPLDYLGDNFQTVYLVDIVHPPQILHKVVGMQNIQPLAMDLTGGAVAGTYHLVQQYRKTGEGSIRDIDFEAKLPEIKADYIVSLNILNQLDILLVDYLERYMKISDDDKASFRKKIQSQHLKLLEPGRSCIVTDFEEQSSSRDGVPVSLKQLIFADLPGGSQQEEWTWAFDTRGTYASGKNTRMMVRGIRI